MMWRSFRSAQPWNARANTCRPRVEPLEGRQLLSSAPFQITGVNPAIGSVVSSLPGNTIVITLNEQVAGLSNGQSPIQTGGTFNPFDVMLIPRGPSGTFSASDRPVAAHVAYVTTSSGSELVLTPTGTLASDVYLVSVDLAAFKDAAGNTLTDVNQGYTTFLLQHQSVNATQPLAVFGVYANERIDNNIIPMPTAIDILFNKALYAGAAGNGNVQLVANPGPNFSVVPSVAAYNPGVNSIELIPTAALSPGTVYAIRVAGQDSGSTYVSDDQGYGGPGYPLATTFYDTFEVAASSFVPASTFTVSSVSPSGSIILLGAVNYVAVQLSRPLDVSSLTPNSVLVVPANGGIDPSTFDAGDAPLDATVAYNPNTAQLIVVPSQLFPPSKYQVLVGQMTSNGSPLLNNSGQPAGVNGNPPYVSTFTVSLPFYPSLANYAQPAPMLVTIPDAFAQSEQHPGTNRNSS